MTLHIITDDGVKLDVSSSCKGKGKVTAEDVLEAPMEVQEVKEEKVYDYIIIGAGITGLLLARSLRSLNYDCLIVSRHLKSAGSVTFHQEEVDSNANLVNYDKHVRSIELFIELNIPLEKREMTKVSVSQVLPVKDAQASDAAMIQEIFSVFKKNRSEVMKAKLGIYEFLHTYMNERAQLYWTVLCSRPDLYSSGTIDVLQLLLNGELSVKTFVTPHPSQLFSKIESSIPVKISEVTDVKREGNVSLVRCSSTVLKSRSVVWTASATALTKISSTLLQTLHVVDIPKTVLWCKHTDSIPSVNPRQLYFPIEGYTMYLWSPKEGISCIICYGYQATSLGTVCKSLPRERVLTRINSTIKQTHLPQVVDFIWKTDPIGTHQYVPIDFSVYGAKNRSDMIYSHYSIISDGFWMAGDSISNYQGYLEGSLESIEILLHSKGFKL